MKVSEPWGIVGQRTNTNYIAQTKKEKDIIIKYITENFDKFELEMEKVQFVEHIPFSKMKMTYWYIKTVTKEVITEEKIMKWYTNKKGGDNNMHKTTN